MLETLMLTLVMALLTLGGPATRMALEGAEVVPTEAEIKREVRQGVKDELRPRRAPKWKFTYTGDLSGEVSGTIATAMPGPFSVAVAGNSMNADRTGTAPQKIQGSIFMREGQPAGAMLTLHLADGTPCRTKPSQDSPLLATQIIDPGKKTFHATFEGTMHCGEKKISVEGYLRKKR